jgi:hypothetical protein
MKSTKLIGIVGKARSGKSSIAQHLWSEHAFTRIALADPLKLAAQQIFGLSDEQALRDEFKEIEIPFWGMSPRQMFQRIGTEASKPVFVGILDSVEGRRIMAENAGYHMVGLMTALHFIEGMPAMSPELEALKAADYAMAEGYDDSMVRHLNLTPNLCKYSC